MKRGIHNYFAAVGILSIAFTAAAADEISVPTFGIDPALKPAVASIASADQRSRPLARVSDSFRHAADFVENEMLVFSNDSAAIRALAARWHGKIVSQSFFPKGTKATPMMVTLVLIDSTLADPQALPADVRKADPLSRGAHTVSSSAGLRTLAAAARENASGLNAGLNYMFSPADLPNWTTQEDNGIDAFQESYLCEAHHALNPSQCVQNIGVGAAWRALKFSGKLENQVKVAIWDSGFAPTEDFPKYYQVTPSSSAGQGGPGSCEGRPCPFHGTNVAAAGFAVPDNQKGDAGPGGALTNVQLNLVSSPSLDVFQFLESLYGWITSVPDTQIINISAGIDIPSSVCFYVCSYISLLTDALREINILVIASAGNDGRDVDQRGTFGLPISCVPLVPCWEVSKLLPCEFDNVLCVGGLSPNSLYRAPDSNYGSDSTDPGATNTVRLFAPFTVRIYDEHHRTDQTPPGQYDSPGVYEENGTSYSAPFVAGIASMVWAANPNLSAGDVENILLNTATPSPDQTVNRYVNALAAVRAALGNHVEPSIRIVCPHVGGNTDPCPHPGTVYEAGTDVVIQADAKDELTGADLSSGITWDGYWTTGPHPQFLTLPAPIPPGNLTVTARIKMNGVSSTSSVTITIQDYTPAVTIYCPSTAEPGHVVQCRGTAMKGPMPLTSSIVWKYVYPGQPAVAFGTGASATITQDKVALPAGQSQTTLQIIAEVPNARATADVIVYPAHANPIVTIARALQVKLECTRPVSNLPCTPFVYVTRVGANAGVPIYQANNISLAGSAVDSANAPIPASQLNWNMQTAAGSGFAQGNSWTGSLQFGIPLTSPVSGTITHPYLLPIVLTADDGHGGASTATANLQVVIQ